MENYYFRSRREISRHKKFNIETVRFEIHDILDYKIVKEMMSAVSNDFTLNAEDTKS